MADRAGDKEQKSVPGRFLLRQKKAGCSSCGVSFTCNGFVYSTGTVILDIHDPGKVLYEIGDYLLTPEKPYETTGFVPNVAFPGGILSDAPTGRIALYYGAADTYTAFSFCQVDELLDYIKKNSEVF